MTYPNSVLHTNLHFPRRENRVSLFTMLIRVIFHVFPPRCYARQTIDAYQWDSDFNEIHFMYFKTTTLRVSKTYSISGVPGDLRVVDIGRADEKTFYITSPCDFYGTCNPYYDNQEADVFLPAIITESYHLEQLNPEIVSARYDPRDMLECDGSYYRPGTAAVATTEKAANNEPRISPNPATDRLQVEIGQAVAGDEITIEFTDVTGRLLKRYNAKATHAGFTKELDISALPKGMALIKIAVNGLPAIVRKLIIR